MHDVYCAEFLHKESDNRHQLSFCFATCMWQSYIVKEKIDPCSSRGKQEQSIKNKNQGRQHLFKEINLSTPFWPHSQGFWFCFQKSIITPRNKNKVRYLYKVIFSMVITGLIKAQWSLRLLQADKIWCTNRIIINCRILATCSSVTSMNLHGEFSVFINK